MSGIVVIGGGIVGVTAAWELLLDGHEVTLVEAGDDIAGQASFANGGQIAVSDSAPWAAPSVPFKLFQWMGRKDAPFRFRPSLDPAQWRWLCLFLLNCSGRALASGAARNLLLAGYSLQCLQKTRARLGSDFRYDDSRAGILRLIGSPREARRARARLEASQKNDGISWLEPPDLAALEPALASAVDRGLIAGAVRGRPDESGDACQFARKLAAEMEVRGVRVLTGCEAADFTTEKGNVTAVSTSKGVLAADGVVLSAGVSSRELAKKAGVNIPVIPVKGYSVTVPVVDEKLAPAASCTDLAHRLVISRLGGRLRVAGFAEIGCGEGLDPARAAAARDRLARLFPDAADYRSPENWVGFRPMTPDGAPIVGRAGKPENLWLNTGHGALGWTLSHGTARLLADMVAGRTPALDMRPFQIKRNYVSGRG